MRAVQYPQRIGSVANPRGRADENRKHRGSRSLTFKGRYLAKESRMTRIAKPRVTSLAPQFLVDDLGRAIAYYREALGFTFDQPWDGFYAIGQLDGLELHLKEAPKKSSGAEAPPRQRASGRVGRRRGHRGVLPAVRRQRR
jgi:hypothetical protein